MFLPKNRSECCGLFPDCDRIFATVLCVLLCKVETHILCLAEAGLVEQITGPAQLSIQHSVIPANTKTFPILKQKSNSNN